MQIIFLIVLYCRNSEDSSCTIYGIFPFSKLRREYLLTMRFIFSRWNEFLFYEIPYTLFTNEISANLVFAFSHGSCRGAGNFRCARMKLRRSSRERSARNWFRLTWNNGSFIYTVTLNARPLRKFHNSCVHTSAEVSSRVSRRKCFRDISAEYLAWDAATGNLPFENSSRSSLRALFENACDRFRRKVTIRAAIQVWSRLIILMKAISGAINMNISSLDETVLLLLCRATSVFV